MKTISKLLALALAVILGLGLIAPVMADTDASNKNDDATKPGEYFGTSVFFDKNFIVPGSATTVPKKDFTFTLEPVSGTTGTDKITAYPGVLTGVSVTGDDITQTNQGTPDVTSISIKASFAGNETLNNANAAAGIGATGEKYATKTFEIDFSGVTFPTDKPGVYRYKLTETAGSNDGITYSTTVYFIDVYVEYEYIGNGDPTTDTDPTHWSDTLTIANIIVTKGEGSTATAPTVTDDQTTNTDKVNASQSTTTKDGSTSDADFNNPIAYVDLELEKQVTGNQGSHTDYFEFTVKITGLAGTYTISGGSYNGDPTSITIPNTADGKGEATVTLHLKKGDKITIEDLIYGTAYVITEKDYTGTNGGYTTTATGSMANPEYDESDAQDPEYNTPATIDPGSYADRVYTGTSLTGDTTVTFTNNRAGLIPTGVLLVIAPFALLTLVGVAGVVVITLKKKRG